MLFTRLEVNKIEKVSNLILQYSGNLFYLFIH